jgi:hypothetical protein
LSKEWAWDAFCIFRRQRRLVKRSLCLYVPLIDPGQDPQKQDSEEDTGVLAELTLELLDQGNGALYPDPECMSFVLCHDFFLKAVDTARLHSDLASLWNNSFDVRWKLTRQDRKTVYELDGCSAGGAFALGLARLLVED